MLASVSARQIQEVGLALGALGGLVIAYGAFSIIRVRSYGRSSEAAHRIEKISYVVGALLITLAFVLSLVAIRKKTAVQPSPTPSVSATPTPSVSATP